MYPTLFTIGKWSVPTYTVLLDLGLILGLVLTYFEGKRLFKDGAAALDVGLWAVVGGIVGGRIGYVLANWAVFGEDWARAIRIWEGGLSFHGAFLGGLLVVVLFAQLHRRDETPISFWQLGDALTPGLALAITFGWAACLMGGCAFGALGQGFGHMILPDLFGIEASRFATQVVGVAFALILFIGFWLLRGHWPFSGASFLMYLLLYFAGQFFLESTRGDEAIYLGPLRLAQVLDLVIVLAAAVGLIVLWQQAGRGAKEQERAGTETEQKEEGAAEVRESAATEIVEEPTEPPAAEGPQANEEPAGPEPPYGTS